MGMDRAFGRTARRSRRAARSVTRFSSLWLLSAVAGCTVGPDYTTPSADVGVTWTQATDPRVLTAEPDDGLWWTVFNDPLLNRLVELAYQNNPTVEAAGVNVLEARAVLGVAVGDFYPQSQALDASYGYQRGADSSGLSAPGLNTAYSTMRFGASTSWEVDLWGKFRRAIESADTGLIAAISAYDDALVTLTADVATVYVNIRTLERRLVIAADNVRTQRGSLAIANSRFTNGETSELDVTQALSTLYETEAQVPLLVSELRQQKNGLAVLLGIPPDEIDALLAPGEIPKAPMEVAAGIPADLLRRRPDVRQAEYEAASQSALIGVAKAQLYPAFSLSGTFGFASNDIGLSTLSDITNWSSRAYSIGPAVTLPIFNFGQLTNQVRQQDAVFQQSILNYQQVVLQAQQEVENGLVEFLQNQEATDKYRRAARAARRSVELATIQYRDGATDYTDVLTAQQAQLRLEDALAQAEGSIPLGLISVYRALGGGWQIRAGNDFVSDETKATMGTRTNWGDLLQQDEHQEPTEAEQEEIFRAPDW